MTAMLPDGRRLGAHLPLSRGLVPAAERAQAIGADTLQVFTDNPTAWKRRAEPPPDVAAFRERVTELGLGPLASHASYLVNLAGSEDGFRERSIDLLIAELETAMAYGIRYVNVHVGSHTGAGLEAGIDRLAQAISRVLGGGPQGPDGPVLVLENSAGSGGGIGVDVEELAAILAACEATGIDPARIAICIDTAHAWGAGYAMGEASGVDALVAEVEERIGLDRLALVHLNDSRSERGSRTDRHTHLGAGRIGTDGLARILTHPALAGATYILETPGMDEGYDAINIARAKALAAGQPLEDLPADAPVSRRSGKAGPKAGPRAAREPDPMTATSG
jgi:deoxyribonuclease-4